MPVHLSDQAPDGTAQDLRSDHGTAIATPLLQDVTSANSPQQPAPSHDAAAAPAVGQFCRTGFVPRHDRFHRLYNRTLGVILLLMTLHIFVVIALALWITQGRHVIYAGERLGRNRKPFDIYKFRTLDSEKAALLTRDRVLPSEANIETPLGKFLRASRLDEMPQIFNIIKGDMNLIGPRPVRDAIARAQEAENPDYAIRYRVTPGLIGHTQAYMAHGTSKRLRSKLNYMLCTSHVNYAAELGVAARVGFEVLVKSARLLAERLVPSLIARRAERRCDDWQLYLLAEGKTYAVTAITRDQMVIDGAFLCGEAELRITTARGGLRRARVLVGGNALSHVHAYAPVNSVSDHYISRYVLGETVVRPKPMRRRDRLRHQRAQRAAAAHQTRQRATAEGWSD